MRDTKSNPTPEQVEAMLAHVRAQAREIARCLDQDVREYGDPLDREALAELEQAILDDDIDTILAFVAD